MHRWNFKSYSKYLRIKVEKYIESILTFYPFTRWGKLTHESKPNSLKIHFLDKDQNEF
jgi:hypothetical protein